MATNIPPHNLNEIINAVVKIIDDQIEDKEETTIEEILKIVKGTRFPYRWNDPWNQEGSKRHIRTGRGKIRVRGHRY